jgi:type IV secretory pathway VirB3-like protein
MAGGEAARHYDVLSVGATRHAVIKSLGVPFWYVIPIVGLPLGFVAVTHNPLWLFLILVLTLIGRAVVAGDHNRPRVLRLAFLSGALLADKRERGGDSTDPLEDTRRV